MRNKRRVLIIDDEPGFTEMVKLNLEATGQFEVRIENQASEAVVTALSYLPELILLDVIMPEIEGPDILLEFKRHPQLKKIPVVFLTATVTKDEVDAEEGNIAGHVFVAKPSTVKELMDCINRQIA